ncbi:RagB/SusD family nutrient uptake outer membrane protein [Pedobacter fastidiosus]|uniref:RagB/SusD family nutrient uptake outer membrane protein n=1 Tax=Pedobacter fastidiosus TaxID=2765361 RepID=A0ABR7KLW3_9SPHI|nr:RagB/SusD family nutrient uptake outer membrane protein [Pedobacter fastidiosus]MBC6109071.1 RagB/SusD family nutrient uptake outer membrane protein [Pedobacter fastidiosus]
MKKIYISIFALALISASGCKKFLEQAPDQRTQVNTVEKVAELLTSAYPEANYIPFTESSSDNAEDKGPTVGSEPREIVLPYYWKDNDDDDEDTPTYYWNSCYQAIAAANAALYAISQANDQTPYAPYKGEALVARAYAHFMLATLYSKTYDPDGANDSPGIPYVTEPEKVVTGQYTRGTVASVYANIEKDLLEGLPLLKNTSYKVPKYHFNVAAGNAFAARFFLFKKEYNKVIQYSSAVAPGNAFSTIIRPWNTRYSLYTLDEMEIYFTQATEPSTLLLIETASSWARTVSPRYGFGQVENNEMFTNNVTGGRWAYKSAYYGVPHYTMLKWNEYFVKTSPNATIGFPYTIVPVLTADEALLNRAEAYASTGQNTLALQDLNTYCSTRVSGYNSTTHAVTLAKIASYYGIIDAKLGLIATILDFKKKEFTQEGLRWFDILRYKINVKHKVFAVNTSFVTMELPADDPRRLFQLPAQVALSGIQQNPR